MKPNLFQCKGSWFFGRGKRRKRKGVVLPSRLNSIPTLPSQPMTSPLSTFWLPTGSLYEETVTRQQHCTNFNHWFSNFSLHENETHGLKSANMPFVDSVTIKSGLKMSKLHSALQNKKCMLRRKVSSCLVFWFEYTP